MTTTVEATHLGERKKIARTRSRKLRPLFSDDQIVHASDIQRSWKQTCESRLSDVDFLVMYSGNKPKAAILDYEKFSALWQIAKAVADDQLVAEATRRVIEASGRTLTSLDELMIKAGITEEELENSPDVELVPE